MHKKMAFLGCIVLAAVSNLRSALYQILALREYFQGRLCSWLRSNLSLCLERPPVKHRFLIYSTSLL